MNVADLQKIMPQSGERATVFLAPLVSAMDEAGITTPLRQSAFLAQVAHESGQLRYVRELASGEAYEGRKDLGNIHAGDGVRFKGRGLIQITGRSNYTALSLALKINCVDCPVLLESPVNACRSAGWFWKMHGLNVLADTQSFATITRRINGGINGLAEREKFYALAKAVLM